jgi:DNA invertase Pin-like site-specific DNA recombinase
MKTKTKAIGYIRVSTADQANSLEVQTRQIKGYCTFKDIELTEIFVDEDVSGGKPFSTREGGIKANKALTNPDINTIISTKPDRFFRDVKDGLNTVDDWAIDKISLHMIDLGGSTIDTQTAIGRMFFIQAISMAEFERRITGERTKAVLNHKKDSGKAYCGSLLGFDNVDGQMVENKKEMNIINDIFRAKGRGMSAAKIANELNFTKTKAKKGGIFHPSTIQAILKNKIYNQHSLSIQ